MATIGNLPEFNPEVTEWTSWFNRFKSFLVVNGIESAEKKRAALLTLIGQSAFDVVSSLVSPDEPAAKTYDELVDLIKKHYGVKKHSYVTARLDFQERKQHEGESIEAWMADLRRIAKDCEFGDQLDKRIRDQLVAGVRSDRTRRELLKLSRDDTNYTVTKCYELCRDAERLEGDIKKLTASSSFSPAITVHAARTARVSEGAQPHSGNRPNSHGNRSNAPFRSTGEYNRLVGACFSVRPNRPLRRSMLLSQPRLSPMWTARTQGVDM